MKANTTNLRETPRNMFRKDDSLYREIAAIDPATGKALVIARIYHPGTVAYACIWIHGANRYGRGTGKAGGYGYHKASAALSEAIDDAGITLSESISGVGDSAMERATDAIARAITGKRRIIIHVAHA